MSQNINFNTPEIPRMTDVFPQAVITDKLIFLSGTPGLDPATGNVISQDFEAQTRQAFQNIKTILEAAGSSMSKIVKTTLFMVTGNEFTIINKIQRIFPIKCSCKKYAPGYAFPGGNINFN